mmetsp:Transcript_21317/g.44327  ORF Transcript_21317/g.44327 Transcript_21317/m.44327 type:complete len:100 (+) Transcript_21317:356-655(+)
MQQDDAMKKGWKQLQLFNQLGDDSLLSLTSSLHYQVAYCSSVLFVATLHPSSIKFNSELGKMLRRESRARSDLDCTSIGILILSSTLFVARALCESISL